MLVFYGEMGARQSGWPNRYSPPSCTVQHVYIFSLFPERVSHHDIVQLADEDHIYLFSFSSPFIPFSTSSALLDVKTLAVIFLLLFLVADTHARAREDRR